MKKPYTRPATELVGVASTIAPGPPLSGGIPNGSGYDELERGFQLSPENYAQPRTTQSGLPDSFRDMRLDEAIQSGLQDTRILRVLNARVLTNPGSIETAFDFAIADRDPVFGTAAALAQFDSEIQSSLTFANNDDVFNNQFLGGGATEVQQDLTSWNWQITRTTDSGAVFSMNSGLQHDNNNGLSNLFNHSWRTLAEATIRKPLLQGSGVSFNRIAGPNSRPGFRYSRGILVSRLGNDINIAEFEQGIRDYISRVIAAYWDLYYSYENFAAAERARDIAYETWVTVKARYENKLPGGESNAEAQAREQYYEFQQRVNDALGGSENGVLQAEADLRRLLGMPQTGREFLRPIDKPVEARIVPEWEQLVDHALASRVEVRKQSSQIRRRELELIAARNFTLPRLDAIATYRNNGFGDDLAGGSGRFSSALRDATNFDHDEWEFGFEYNVQMGSRRARAGVRHAELNLRREKVVLEEQGKQIIHDLGSAVRQLDRSYNNLQFAIKRLEAAQTTVDARTATYDEGLSSIVDLLDAHRRLNKAEVDLYRSRTEYARANFSIMREGGHLLHEYSVTLVE